MLGIGSAARSRGSGALIDALWLMGVSSRFARDCLDLSSPQEDNNNIASPRIAFGPHLYHTGA